MRKLPVLSGREVIKILTRIGFGRGKEVVYKKVDETFVVATVSPRW